MWTEASRGCGVVIIEQSPKLEEVNITGNYTNYVGAGGDGAGISGENSDFILITLSDHITTLKMEHKVLVQAFQFLKVVQQSTM